MSRFTSIQDLTYFHSDHILVETTEEFLSTFNLKNFYDKRFLAWLSRYIPKDLKSRASGSFGYVFTTPEDNFIVKKIPICAPIAANTTTRRLCEIAKEGSFIFRIPYTPSNKEMIIAPNYITEYLVSVLLYRDLHKYTPSVPRMFGYQYSPNDATAYVVMEKLEDLRAYVTTKSDYLYFIMQILLTLEMAQNMGRFVHRDLHISNIMVRPKKQNNPAVVSYPVGDFLFFTRMNYDAVMIDFGLSRYETPGHILSPNLLFSTGSAIDMIDYYQFTPYYDVISIVAALVLDKGIFPYKPTDALLTLLVNYATRGGGIDELVKGDGVWRPDPTKLALLPVGRANRPGDVAELIAQHILEDLQGSNFETSLFENGIAVVRRRPSFPNHIRGERINYTTVPKREDTTFYHYVIRETDKFDGVTVSTVRDGKFRKELRSFNKMIPRKASLARDLSNQVIHVARIVCSNAFEFSLDCCKVDPKMYFQSEAIAGGVAINASFFRYKTDYLPVGYYKFGSFRSSTPIPGEYRYLYSLIGIDYDGNIHIEEVSQDGMDTYPQYFTCGPTLVRGGRSVITDELLSEDKYLSCRNARDMSEATSKRFSDEILNCGNLADGELGDISNPRPRSAICVDKKGTVYLVYVEGREQKGAGMDASQLTQFCMSLGSVNAVALGDGLGSGMVWRKPGENLICMPNNERTYSFPVGTVLGYSRKRQTGLSPLLSVSDD